MPRESKRRLLVMLPGGAYKKLAEWAARDDRVASQQASYLLRTLLEADEPTAPAAAASAAAGAVQPGEV